MNIQELYNRGELNILHEEILDVDFNNKTMNIIVSFAEGTNYYNAGLVINENYDCIKVLYSEGTIPTKELITVFY